MSKKQKLSKALLIRTWSDEGGVLYLNNDGALVLSDTYPKRTPLELYYSRGWSKNEAEDDLRYWKRPGLVNSLAPVSNLRTVPVTRFVDRRRYRWYECKLTSN